jgi:hypothetical protein
MIISLFESRTMAEQAVNALLSEGYSRDQLSVVTADSRSAPDMPDIGPKDSIGSGVDAGTGAAVGGIAGFLGGLVALAIPGVGPIIAAGPLAAGIMGAGIGAAAGGLAGALKSYGVPENHASQFSEAIRRGRVMVTAYVPSDRADHASDLLERHGAIDVDTVAEDVPPPSRGTPAEFRPISAESRATRFEPELESVREKQQRRSRAVYVYPGVTGGGTVPRP